MKKNLKKLLLGLITVSIIFAGDFLFGLAPKAKEITWGVNFSQKHAESLGLDWQNTYSALLDDLSVRNLKLITYWDLIEPKEGKLDFEDLDWQIKKAEEKGVKVFLVIGIKTPRWPECHEPEWVKAQSAELKSQSLLKYIETLVNRYKDSPAIWAWQVENEPFLKFGECPWPPDEELLGKEIALVKKLDPEKPVVISGSGEWSFWIREAKIGDMVGITMYKIVWISQFERYLKYPFSPLFYWLKAKTVEKMLEKKVMVVELQTEPWGPTLLYDSPLNEQQKTMNLDQFKRNIDFAKKTGLDEFYLWGAEWWFWMKEKQDQPEIWNEARKLFPSFKNEILIK